MARPSVARKKKALSPAKARLILREGAVRGQLLTEKQEGFFGARAGGAPVKRKRSRQRAK